MFFQCNQRETIAEAFQKTLRSSQGLRETSFILKPISHDVWEQIVTLKKEHREEKRCPRPRYRSR